MTIRPGPIRGSSSDATGSPWDLVVIGGGIYGVCVALEAARRELRTVLVERGDFGGATSWSSHRIIHGGLRYLQSLDLPRFRDSIRERRWFAETLPGLVESLPCLMPLYGDGLKRPSAFRAALALNASLGTIVGGSTPRIPHGRVLNTSDTIDRFSGVPSEGLRGGAVWHDGRMVSSERVLICLLRRACDLGAIALNGTEATRLVVEQGTVRGIEITDLRSGSTGFVNAPRVIDCGGPWVGSALGAASDADRGRLFPPARAFNLVLDCPPPSRSAVAVAAREAGAPTLFLVPMGDRTVAGTWHEAAEGDAPNPMPSAESIDRFLAEIARAIPGFAPTPGQVRCIWSGLLPAERAGVAETSDRAVVLDHAQRGGPTGLLSVSGVKYTTARLVAERAVRIAFGRTRSPTAIGALEDPLSSAGLGFGLEIGQTACADLARRMRDEEAATTIEDAVLRRSMWYLEGPSSALTAGLAEAYSRPEPQARHELERVRCSIRGPLNDSQN